ncbi:MAG: hypothetical protein ACPGWS_09320, partial [Solirubrobacterales bacterium]
MRRASDQNIAALALTVGILAASICAGATALAGPTQAATIGSITQLSGLAGCTVDSATPISGCATARA